jgi:N-acetylglutamate synthase-like GNAT family acetyltransferase
LVELCKQRARARGVKELFAVTSQTGFFERAGFATFRREKTAMFFEVG